MNKFILKLQHHFQQYFSYIVVLVSLVEETKYPEKTTNRLQVTEKNLSHQAYVATGRNQTHNFSGDKH